MILLELPKILYIVYVLLKKSASVAADQSSLELE